MDLYELLGVSRDASTRQIKLAYRKLAKKHHPDAGGDPEKFRELQLAHDVLTDGDRRKTYDATGRTSELKISPSQLKSFIAGLLKTVVNFKHPATGLPDNPGMVNVRDKMIISLSNAKFQAEKSLSETRKLLDRTNELIRRFLPPQEGDVVGDLLRDERDSLMRQMEEIEREIEVANMATTIIKSYGYKIDLTGEGPIPARPEVIVPNRGGSTYRVGGFYIPKTDQG